MARRFNYQRSRQTADRLITKFGQTGAVRRTTIEGGNEWDPESGEEVTIDHACTLAVLEYSERERDGTLVQANDRKVYVSAVGLGIDPGVEDELVIGGVVYSVINVKPLAPAGTAVYFEVQARS